jgi:predicted ATP-grasp superfamily ATP-dependent carboligase
MSTPRAFVLTHRSHGDPGGYTASFQALAIARSLGRRGVPVVRVHPGTRELSLASRYCSALEQSPNVHDSEEALLEFLLGLAPKYPGERVLIPASDDTAFFVGRHREALLAAYRVPSPGRDTIETIMDKRRQYDAAQALGVPIPETYYPSSPAEVAALAPTLKGYPYIIKPTVAHHWRLASVRRQLRVDKAVIVHQASELLAQYSRISAVDPALMIQKVIHGGDELLYCFYGYFDARSRPLGYCVRRKIRQMPPRFGYSTLMESCEHPAVVEQSIRLLQGLDYHGIGAIEWKHDPDTGVCRLIEINARATNAASLPTACGVDLPAMAFDDALGNPPAPLTRWESGVKWIWFTEDLWAARERYRRREMGLADWMRSLRGKKAYAVFAADDWRPFLLECWMFMKGEVERRLRRILPLLGRRGRLRPAG